MVFLCEKYSQAVRAHAPYARAIQPYTAPSPDYLSVKIGDLLSILHQVFLQFFIPLAPFPLAAPLLLS